MSHQFNVLQDFGDSDEDSSYSDGGSDEPRVQLAKPAFDGAYAAAAIRKTVKKVNEITGRTKNISAAALDADHGLNDVTDSSPGLSITSTLNSALDDILQGGLGDSKPQQLNNSMSKNSKRENALDMSDVLNHLDGAQPKQHNTWDFSALSSQTTDAHLKAHAAMAAHLEKIHQHDQEVELLRTQRSKQKQKTSRNRTKTDKGTTTAHRRNTRVAKRDLKASRRRRAKEFY